MTHILQFFLNKFLKYVLCGEVDRKNCLFFLEFIVLFWFEWNKIKYYENFSIK